ncbi:DUF4229 domain-containing protein [Nakamurella aerolata]|uniref:DUF4229 domain-containing protein n=1 Tax=Nakamurella aerolata TaxID=1656892 RepID=A0A849A1X2_9ACTN|nr:DUF4229 domain-containing protein [Nakamurella aerolata]
MSSSASGQSAAEPAGPARAGAGIATIVGYVALRLGLLVVLATVIWGVAALVGLEMPVLVAAMLAIITGLPLSWLIFSRQRLAATEALEQRSGERRRTRAELQQALEGTQGVPRATPPAGEPGDERDNDERHDDERDRGTPR